MRNRMQRYNIQTQPSGAFFIDDIRNAISPRHDLHRDFDDRKFVYVPKLDLAMFVHLLHPTHELKPTLSQRPSTPDPWRPSRVLIGSLCVGNLPFHSPVFNQQRITTSPSRENNQRQAGYQGPAGKCCGLLQTRRHTIKGFNPIEPTPADNWSRWTGHPTLWQKFNGATSCILSQSLTDADRFFWEHGCFW